LWREVEIPATPLVTIDELVAAQPLATHPVTGEYRQTRPPARLSVTPMQASRPAPLPGQHNAEILAELGYSDADIDDLRASGVLRGTSARE
jgi:crotonobetainyl-CoA:carnitine CoA-transferase CaiB-like acyl-CoA transferase